MNIPLLILDLVFLPITIFRIGLIYLYGSKYNLNGFKFLDVILHADKPMFNYDYQNDEINTIEKDYRIVIRDDSRLYPVNNSNIIRTDMIMNTNTTNNEPLKDDIIDINTCDDDNKIISGTTSQESKWILPSNEYFDKLNKDKINITKHNIDTDIYSDIDEDNINNETDNNEDSENDDNNEDSDDENEEDSDSNDDSEEDSDSDDEDDSEDEEKLLKMFNNISDKNEEKDESSIINSIYEELNSAFDN